MKLVEIIDAGDLRIFSTGISTSYDFSFTKLKIMQVLLQCRQ